MIKIVFTLILGIMSLLIIKEYLEILLINKMLKHQWLFWELNLIVTIILENDCKFRFIGSPIPLATDQFFRS